MDSQTTYPCPRFENKMTIVSSSVPSKPTFRSMAMNTVAIVPLLSSSSASDDVNYSLQSFEHLMKSLERYAQQRMGGQDYSPTQSSISETTIGSPYVPSHKDIDIIIPNEQLTRPGDWKYDNTPLRSHAWHNGCQRMVCFDGRDLSNAVIPRNEDWVPPMSPWAQDRLSNNPMYQAFSDLYPSRGTSAVIGVVSVKDFESINTLDEADRELDKYTEKYSLQSYRSQLGGGLVQGWDPHGIAYEEKMHTVTRRIFIFDTFDDSTRQKIDLSQTRLFKSGALIAFPPVGTNMMDLHLTVVLNDLAVAIFLQLEDRIRLCDGGKTKSMSRKGSLGTSKGDEPVGPTEKLGISNLVTLVGPGTNAETSARMDGKAEEESGLSLFSSAIKALNSAKGPETNEYLHFTPVDTRFVIDKLSSKELEFIVRRNAGRREKYAGDLCLLAGSPMDAYERYTRATELSKRNHDPLYYAAALEGCAASFVAMSDIGGHGVDEYLDENFQYPDDIMALVLANQQGSQDYKVDKTKTTMPAAIFALMEEALSVVRCHILLSSIHSEMLLKMAWYTAELEEAHVHCRWGDGCIEGLDTNRPHQLERWQKTSLAKMELKGVEGLLEPLISAKNLAQSQKFCDLLHRATFNGGLDLSTKSTVASRCAALSLSGVKLITWPLPTTGSSYSCATFPRKAAFFSHIAAESLALSPNTSNSSFTNQLWIYAFNLHSLGENLFRSSDQYAWASIRATLLHSLIQRAELSSIENAAFCLLNLLSEITGDFSMTKNSSSALDSLASQISTSEVDIDMPDSIMKSSKKETITRRTNPTRSRFSVQGVTSFAFLQSKWLDDDPVPLIPFPFVDPTFLVRLLKDELKSHPFVKDLILSVNRLPSYPSLNCVIPLKRAECYSMSELCLNILDKNIGVITDKHMQSIEHSWMNICPISIKSVLLVNSESHLALERVKPDVKTSTSSSMKAVFFNPFAKANSATNVAVEEPIAECEERIIEIAFENIFLVSLYIQNCTLLFEYKGKYRLESTPQSFVLPPRSSNFAVKFTFIILPSNSTEEIESGNKQTVFTLSGLKFSYLRQTKIIQFNYSASYTTPSQLESQQVVAPASIYKRSAHNVKVKKSVIKAMTFQPIPTQPKIMIACSGVQDMGDGYMIPVEISEGEIHEIPSIQVQNSSGYGLFHRLQILLLSSSDVPLQCLYDTQAEIKTNDNGSVIETKLALRRSSTSRIDENLKTSPVLIEIVKNTLSIESLNQSDTEKISFTIRGTSPGTLALADSSILKLRFRYRGPSNVNGLEYWRKKDINFRIIKTKGPRISSIALRPDLSWSDTYPWLDSMKKAHIDGTNTIDYHVANEGVISVIEVVNESSTDIVLTNQRKKITGLKGEELSAVNMASGTIIQIPVILPRICHSKKDKEQWSIITELSNITLFEWASQDINESTSIIKPVSKKRRGILHISHYVLEAIAEKRKLIGFTPVKIIVRTDRQDCLYAGDVIDINVEVEVAEWVLHNLDSECSLSIQLLGYRRDSLEPLSSSNEYVWCGHSHVTYLLSTIAKNFNHRARICFLNPGLYMVSAFAYFSGSSDCTMTERWLAKEPCLVEVKEDE